MCQQTENTRAERRMLPLAEKFATEWCAQHVSSRFVYWFYLIARLKFVSSYHRLMPNEPSPMCSFTERHISCACLLGLSQVLQTQNWLWVGLWALHNPLQNACQIYASPIGIRSPVYDRFSELDSMGVVRGRTIYFTKHSGMYHLHP